MNPPRLSADAPSDHVIEAVTLRGVSRRYGRRTVVDQVDLDIPEGQILGLLGPNGAGKTTLLRIIAGLTSATDGTVVTLDTRVRPGVVAPGLGLVLEESGMLPGLSATKNLRLLAELTDDPVDIPGALRDVGLDPDNHRPIRTWSQGMRRRLVIAQALMSHPRLLLLDEPTNGLDPAGVAAVRALLQRLRAEGVTIVVSSHALTEVERLCDRVVFMKQARIVEDIALTGRAHPVVIGLAAGSEVAAYAESLARAGVSASVADGALRVDAPASVPDVVRYLVRDGAAIETVERTSGDLERLFLTIVGTDLK